MDRFIKTQVNVRSQLAKAKGDASATVHTIAYLTASASEHQLRTDVIKTLGMPQESLVQQYRALHGQLKWIGRSEMRQEELGLPAGTGSGDGLLHGGVVISVRGIDSGNLRQKVFDQRARFATLQNSDRLSYWLNELGKILQEAAAKPDSTEEYRKILIEAKQVIEGLRSTIKAGSVRLIDSKLAYTDRLHPVLSLAYKEDGMDRIALFDGLLRMPIAVGREQRIVSRMILMSILSIIGKERIQQAFEGDVKTVVDALLPPADYEGAILSDLIDQHTPIILQGQNRILYFESKESKLGSNDLYIYRDINGRKYFVKELWHSGRAVAEYFGHAFFRMLGLPVPELYEVATLGNGNLAVVTDHVEDFQTVKDIGWRGLTAENQRLVRLAYYADSLLSTWDRHSQNIRVYYDENGEQRIQFFDWDHTLGYQRWVTEMESSQRNIFSPSFDYYARVDIALKDNALYAVERSERGRQAEFLKLFQRAYDKINHLAAEVEEMDIFRGAFGQGPNQIRPGELSADFSALEPSGIVGAMHRGQTLFEEMKERFGRVLERHGWDRVIDRLEKRRDGDANVMQRIRDMLDELVEGGLISREQADRMASRIIPVRINESKLERGEEQLGGLIVRHRGVLKILFPLQQLDKSNKNALGNLLHELVEIELLEDGFQVDEAHRQAQNIQEAFERGDVAFSQFMIKDLLNIFSDWKDAARALDGINKMPAAPALNRLNAVEAFLSQMDDDSEFKYLFARIDVVRRGLEKDIALQKIAAAKGRQFFDVTGWLADDFGDNGWGHVTVGEVLVKVAVDGDGHLDPGFNIDNQGIFVNRGPGQAARVRLQNNAGMAPLMFSDQELGELGIQITKIAEPVIREKVPLTALTEEAKLRAVDVILNEMDYQKRAISESEIKKISENLDLDEQIVRARVNPKESSRELFNQRMGFNGAMLEMKLNIRGHEIDELFGNYNTKIGAFVISDDLMDALGDLGGMKNGLALNLAGFVFIRESALTELENGQKEAMLTLKHEQLHTVYDAIHGYETKTVQQNLINELYAFFGSFLDVYGVAALSSVQERQIGKGTWAQIVLNALVKDYLNNVSDEQVKTDLIERLRFAVSILNFSLQNSAEVEMVLDYLKSITSLDQILVMVTQESFSTVTQGGLEVDNFDALQEAFKNFREDHKVQASRDQTASKNEIIGAAHRNNVAASVVGALNPDSGEGLTRAEVRQVYELTTSDFDGFTDAIVETWLNRTEDRAEVTEDRFEISQAAIDESGRLINHLQASRETAPLPTGTITLGMRLTVENNTSFLAQLFKVLQSSGEKAEVLAEADAVKKIPVTDDANVAVRPVKPIDWQHGFRALSSSQEDVPVALDVQFMNEQMEGMFNGILLNWGESKPGRLVEDFGELVFAVILVEMAKIFADSKHKAQLSLLRTKEAKADYLTAQLLQRLPQLGYSQDGKAMLGFQNGYFTIDGTIAVAFLEMKAKEAMARAA